MKVTLYCRADINTSDYAIASFSLDHGLTIPDGESFSVVDRKR
jgi:hypothetical protein